ncbi:hypothetical protein B9Q04_19345 [Candidatus Marsarchaeota G2 archaeon BE_D]|uniref:Uncharacterized protein n=1 Tax=Candidatus Marsarchaeota G2 archaeon BE_D TaxID=1978158 RepID=A0A2R6C1C7_9ARCH|nr:MAG: hypothetical protein B9Q04_19345 [Candidatus Marsarchaeota G2 archaeon BE_D]
MRSGEEADPWRLLLPARTEPIQISRRTRKLQGFSKVFPEETLNWRRLRAKRKLELYWKPTHFLRVP